MLYMMDLKKNKIEALKKWRPSAIGQLALPLGRACPEPLVECQIETIRAQGPPLITASMSRG
jgi:hypothetical protein